MKKILGLLLLMVLTMSLFAASDGGSYKKVVTVPFRPTLYSTPGTLAYKMYNNQAELARNRFMLQLPNVSVTMYNVAKAMSAPTTAEALSKISHLDFSSANLINLASKMMLNLGTGRNDVITINAGLGFAINKFGFSFDLRADSRTKPSEGSTGIQNIYNTEVVPLVNAAATVAYGTRIYETNSFFLDLGVGVRYALKGYATGISGKNAVEYLEHGTSLSMMAKSGFAIPFDVALTYGIMNGNLRFNLNVNNLNGYYYMKDYQIDKPEDLFAVITGGKTPISGSNFVLYTPWQLNLGLVWEPKVKVLNPVFSFTIEDINGYIKEDLNKNGGKKPGLELITHLVARIDLRIVKVVNLSIAFQNGYPMFGLSAGFKGNTIEVSYSFHEAGDLYGAKPVDALTFRVKFGFDSN